MVFLAGWAQYSPPQNHRTTHAAVGQMVPVEGVTPARLINSLPCPTFAKSPIEFLGIFEIVPPSYAGRRPPTAARKRGPRRVGLLNGVFDRYGSGLRVRQLALFWWK